MTVGPNKQPAASTRRRWAVLFVAAISAAGCSSDSVSVVGAGEGLEGTVERDEPHTSPTSAEGPDRTVPPSTTLPIVEGQATVRLTFDQEDANSQGPDVPWPEGRAAIIEPADTDQFWEAITGLEEPELLFEDGGVWVAEQEGWSRPQATEEALASAPAIIASSNQDGEAEVVVEAGDYLVCGMSSSDPEQLKIINCEEIRIPQDSHVNLYSADATVFISRRDP